LMQDMITNVSTPRIRYQQPMTFPLPRRSHASSGFSRARKEQKSIDRTLC
jgi:hypothetical protein